MKKIAGIIAALSCASALAVGAGAQGIVNDVSDGAENIVDDAGKDENFVPPTTAEKDPNPSTGVGVPFLTAGLVLTGAAGVAYFSRKRNEDNLTK